MQVDNLFQPNFNYTASFDDFFNLDLGAPAEPSSRGSSQSPSDSFTTLATPPHPTSTNSFFNFYLDEEFTKVDPLAPPPATVVSYDFLGALAASATQSCSPDSGSGSGSSSVESPMGIDPQLVGTPSQSKAMSEFADDEDEEPEGDEEDGDDLLSNAGNDEMSIIPIKVGGRGKAAGRKGTVQSGGVVKKSGGGSDKKDSKSGLLSTTTTEPDDWRPSPEEYKKMSSKEKRQLRNKISARNFRVRRKEYITTLEGDIAERDRLIDAIRSELGSTKSENSALRHEVAALKKALLEGRGRADTPILPPPAPLSAVSAAATVKAAAASKNVLLTPNTHKDLPTSPRIGARGFWGGSTVGPGAFGGITPVHTTLMPEWGSVLSGKPFGATSNVKSLAERRSPALQENINPIMNNMRDKPKEQTPQQFGGFDAFTDMNPFTLKTLDAYRMQLWGKMAQQQAVQNQQTRQQVPQQSPTPNNFAGNVRPHYFTKSPTLGALISGKPAAAAYPSPPSSPPMRAHAVPSNSSIQPSSSTSQAGPTPQQAMLASLASQTLMGKLGSAFWEAFSGPGQGKRGVDTDKVRRVLEGKAVVRVVDVEPTQQSRSGPSARVPVRNFKTSPHTSPKMGPSAPSSLSEAKGCFTDVLEESMRSLSLGKRQ